MHKLLIAGTGAYFLFFGVRHGANAGNLMDATDAIGALVMALAIFLYLGISLVLERLKRLEALLPAPAPPPPPPPRWPRLHAISDQVAPWMAIGGLILLWMAAAP